MLVWSNAKHEHLRRILVVGPVAVTLIAAAWLFFTENKPWSKAEVYRFPYKSTATFLFSCNNCAQVQTCKAVYTLSDFASRGIFANKDENLLFQFFLSTIFFCSFLSFQTNNLYPFAYPASQIWTVSL